MLVIGWVGEAVGRMAVTGINKLVSQSKRHVKNHIKL